MWQFKQDMKDMKENMKETWKRHHLVLAYHMTATFCAHASDVCGQETVYQKFQ